MSVVEAVANFSSSAAVRGTLVLPFVTVGFVTVRASLLRSRAPVLFTRSLF